MVGAVLVSTTLLLRSIMIGFVLSIASGLVLTRIEARKIERERLALAALWPEILDHLISGLRSGMSLAETLIGLSQRGPDATKGLFRECEKILRDSGDFDQVFAKIKESFHDGLADQVCEVLNFARGTGSRDTSITLRSLGDFIRSDISLRSEIRSKHGWIKNSAMIAAAAPWILLVILSTQANTLKAFSTPNGIAVLGAGVVMTVLAYFWMERVGRLSEIPRIFK